MAVEMLKHTGEGGITKQLFPTHQLNNRLDEGWATTPEAAAPLPWEEEEGANSEAHDEGEKADEAQPPVSEEDEGERYEAVRQAARAAGISNWHTKGIDRLKQEMAELMETPDNEPEEEGTEE